MLHIAASLVVAYEQLKEGPIMEAFAKWKAYYLLATADADFKPEVGSDEELREKWEMNTMIKVTCSCALMSRHTIMLRYRPAAGSGVRSTQPACQRYLCSSAG